MDLTGYHLTFDDEFSGTSLDTSKWIPQWTTGSEHPTAYKADQALSSNVTVSGGELRLEAARGSTTDGRPYSVGVVQTYNKFAQKYGYIEASIKVPAADGMWPAFWTFPQSGAWTHEIDITEMFMADRLTNHMSNHFPDASGNDRYVTQAYTGPDFSAGFHTFGVMWTPTSLTYYIDGVDRFTTTTSVPNESMFLILNDDTDQIRPSNAVDSSTPFPNYMDVDYVRVYATSPSPPVTTGTGSDSLTLSISENASLGDALGDAQFTVAVDGKQLGGTFTTTASHAAGVSQSFTFNGDWAPGAHTVAVDFLNGAYAGTSGTDRNLYVNAIRYDGSPTNQGAALMSSGAKTFSLSDSTPIPSPAIGSGADTLVFNVSEDAYLGNAQFTVAVDGHQLGGTFTATASHAAGAGQTFTFKGDFGTGQHAVAVTFLNDAYAGTPSTDRNLYINAISYDGTNTGQSAGLYVSGPHVFAVSGGTAPAVSETSDHGALSKTLAQTGTYTVGGDRFLLSSNNVATVTLGTGASQIKFLGASTLTLTGGSGQATVTADAGTNRFVAGAGSLEVAGGGGKDGYVFHANSGLLTLDDFSLAKGDKLTVDKALQGALILVSDLHGGTVLSFGHTGQSIDIHGLATMPSTNIVWT